MLWSLSRNPDVQGHVPAGTTQDCVAVRDFSGFGHTLVIIRAAPGVRRERQMTLITSLSMASM